MNDTPLAFRPPLLDVVRDGALSVSIEHAALVLAKQEYPQIDVGIFSSQLDRAAEDVMALLTERPDEAEVVGAVNDTLFGTMKFRGNREHYYDPRNSFLNIVMERRRGIPITLSVIYRAVAARAGLDVECTGFPGHFLLRVPRQGWPIVIDAFEGGRILDEDDCRSRLQQLGVEDWHAEYLDPVDGTQVLRRMLNNLKIIYFKSQDWARLHRTTRQIQVVSPEDHDEFFTLGVSLAGMHCFAESLEAFENYLELRPDAANRLEVLKMMRELAAQAKRKES